MTGVGFIQKYLIFDSLAHMHAKSLRGAYHAPKVAANIEKMQHNSICFFTKETFAYNTIDDRGRLITLQNENEAIFEINIRVFTVFSDGTFIHCRYARHNQKVYQGMEFCILVQETSCRKMNEDSF